MYYRKNSLRSAFAHNNGRLQYSYINSSNVSCREYNHYLANKTKIKEIRFRKSEVLNRLYDTSLNEYKDKIRKELQKKYTTPNSTKRKKVNMDRIAELFAGGIKNENKAKQEKEKMLREIKKPIKRSIVSSNSYYSAGYTTNSECVENLTQSNSNLLNKSENISDNFVGNLSQATNDFDKQLSRTSSIKSFNSYCSISGLGL